MSQEVRSLLEEDRTRSWFCRMSGFSLVEGNGRTFPPEGKEGAGVGKEVMCPLTAFLEDLDPSIPFCMVLV